MNDVSNIASNLSMVLFADDMNNYFLDYNHAHVCNKQIVTISSFRDLVCSK